MKSKDQWHSFNVQGWGGYVLILKEKFKLIKGSLKKWHVLVKKKKRSGM
jgi:hypothetical protein